MSEKNFIEYSEQGYCVVKRPDFHAWTTPAIVYNSVFNVKMPLQVSIGPITMLYIKGTMGVGPRLNAGKPVGDWKYEIGPPCCIRTNHHVVRCMIRPPQKKRIAAELLESGDLNQREQIR